MPTIKLEIDVPTFEPDELRSAIVQAAARHCLGIEGLGLADCERDECEHDGHYVWGGLPTIRRDIEKQVKTRIQGVVDDEVPKVVREVLDGEFTPVSRWGDMGKITTVRGMIGTLARDWLEKVEPRSKKTKLVKELGGLVDEVIRNDLKKEMAAVTTSIRAGLVGRVDKEVTKVVQRILGIQPSDMQRLAKREIRAAFHDE